MKFKKIVESKKEIKNQKDLVDNMDLEDIKSMEEKGEEEHKENVKVFKDALNQCSLVEGYNYTIDKNNLYTVNIKDRKQLAKLVENLKQNKIKHRISRSKLEGYKYDVMFKNTLAESLKEYWDDEPGDNFGYNKYPNLTFKYEVHAVDDKDEDKVYKEFANKQQAVKYAKNNKIKCFIDEVTYSKDGDFVQSDTIYGPADLGESKLKENYNKDNLDEGIYKNGTKFIQIKMLGRNDVLVDKFDYSKEYGKDYAFKNRRFDYDSILHILNNGYTKVNSYKEDINKGNNTPITDEDQKKEWEAEDANTWNESLDKNNLKQEIKDACRKAFKEVFNFDDEDTEESLDEIDIEVQDYKDMSNQPCIRVVLGNGYLTRRGLEKLCKYVEDNVLSKYDKDAYFEGEDISSYSAIIRDKELIESNLANSTLKKGDKVRLDKEHNSNIEDKSLLDDEYEVIGFWNNEKVVDDDKAPENVRDLSGVRIKNTRTGKQYSVNRYQLTSIDESLKLNEDPTQDRLEELKQISRQRQLTDDEVRELAELSRKKYESCKTIKGKKLTEGEFGEDLELNEQETQELLENGAIDIARYLGSVEIHVEERPYEEDKYDIYIINPFDEVKLATNESLKEEKKKQPKWRYNGNAEKSAEFIANGTNLAGQPCCEDYDNNSKNEAFSLLGDYDDEDEEEQNWGYELSIDGNIVDSNEGYENEIDALEDAIWNIENYQFDSDYMGDTSKEQFIISTTLDGGTESEYDYQEAKKYLGIKESLKEAKVSLIKTDKYGKYGTEVKIYQCEGDEITPKVFTATVKGKTLNSTTLNELEKKIINAVNSEDKKADNTILNDSLKESDEEDEVIKDESEEIEIDDLDDINIDEFDDIDLDNISLDDIVDEDEQALEVIKDKLDMHGELAKDGKKELITVAEKGKLDDKKAPKITFEADEEETEILAKQFCDDCQEDEEEVQASSDSDDDNIDFDEITDAEQVNTKDVVANLKNISVIDTNKNKEETKPEEEVVDVDDEDMDDTSFLTNM